MKHRILFFSLITFLSTSCSDQNFKLDDIMQQCYVSKYHDKGFDIKAIVEDYESLLIKDGVLKSDSGNSYLEALQRIMSDKDFRINAIPFMEYDPWQKVDKEIGVAIFECEQKIIAIAKEKDPKWRKLFRKFDSAEKEADPEMLYQAMVENLSEKDLNSYYFKLKMFRIFDSVNSKWENQSR